ncbi:MoaD/ThiS family protein [uncultured Cytophaga sp.]|uniref:MoaD/ThiS family protein n=1 Tax=uncultured Cytophaga sp. TaxID=160238 RepID=UPI0026034F18|nr:MoaD/ThiS family protein [uncultured Cytophaga sp.]
MKIHVFAALKDFMPSEFELVDSSVTNINEMKEILKLKFPNAEKLIDSCRFSTEHEILSFDQEIKNYENIFVIPPSSGG